MVCHRKRNAPSKNLGAIRRLPWYNVCRQRPLVFAPTDYCKSLGNKPLQNRERFRHLSYFTFARSAHVVTMAVIAGAGFEPATFGLWARRATAATTLHISIHAPVWGTTEHHCPACGLIGSHVVPNIPLVIEKSITGPLIKRERSYF